MLAKADSLLIIHNDTITYYLCDERPQMPGNGDYDITMEAQVPDTLKKLLHKDNEGNSPFMDIGFYIDKKGIASNYFINYYYDCDSKVNRSLKNKLFKIAINKLIQIQKWNPGKVKGQIVISENNVRVYF